jgi:hypothetical protein
MIPRDAGRAGRVVVGAVAVVLAARAAPAEAHFLTERVSVGPGGAQSNGPSVGLIGRELALSADGRYAAFSSFATNLVPGDTNGPWTCSSASRWTEASAPGRAALDVVRLTGPPLDEPEVDQGGGEQVEAEQDVEPALVADGEPADAGEPGQRALDHP